MLKHPKESFHNNFVSLDCDQCTMVTQHGKPMFTQVLPAPTASAALLPWFFVPSWLLQSHGTVHFGLVGMASVRSRDKPL